MSISTDKYLAELLSTIEDEIRKFGEDQTLPVRSQIAGMLAGLVNARKQSSLAPSDRFHIEKSTEIILSHVRGKILEVGCGIGELAFQIAQKTASAVLGIDRDKTVINIAQRTKDELKIKNLQYRTSDIRDFDFGDKFDTIIFSFVLHDYSNPKAIISAAAGHLEKAGQILVVDIDHNNLMSVIESDFRTESKAHLGRKHSHGRLSDVFFLKIV